MLQNKNYDSEFCGSLPLHLINLIQPYGILFVLNKPDFKVLQVSENIQAVTGVSPAEIVSKSFSDFVASHQFASIERKIAEGATGKIPARLTFTVKDAVYNFLCLFQSKDDYVLLEMELAGINGKEELFADVYQEVKYAMSEINQAENTIEVCNVAIRELRRLSGFDKIMLYKFDENWNGEVIAETKEETMESYLGLRFPASDIPKQARALYFKNPYRLIPTINYTPVKIYPVINSTTGSFIDLSNCNLRSVPAVHLEYLKNMGVMASMSTAIIKDEQLWGLISCHHKTEKYLNFEMCSVFELMAGLISSRINIIESRDKSSLVSQLQQVKSKLMEQVYLDDNPITALVDYDADILKLLECDGAVILYDKKMQTKGVVPERYEIKELVMWLQNQQIDKTYAVSNLLSVYDNATAFGNIASGIVVLPIHASKGEYIIGFRPEVVQNVNWGGNPNEAIKFEANRINYHPRNSFKLWRQTVEGTSLAWEKDHLEVIESFRNFLIEYTLNKVYSNL